MTFELWPEQQVMVGGVRTGFRTFRSILLPSATGSGKTRMGAFMTRSASEKGNEVIWLAHRKELIEGTSNTFQEAGIPHSVLMGGRHHNPRLRVTIASVAALANRLDIVRPPKLLITDECFPVGTLIDGIPIERITPGILVTTFNHGTGRSEIKPVVAPMTRAHRGDWYRVTASDGRQFVCTENHPVYVRGVGYVPAKSLREHVGCAIVTSAHLSCLPLIHRPEAPRPERQAEVLQCEVRGRLRPSGLHQPADGRPHLSQLRREGGVHEPETVHGRQAFGPGLLRRGVQVPICEPGILGNHAGHQPTVSGGNRATDDRAEPDGRSATRGDNDGKNEGSDVPRPGRQRAADHPATEIAQTHRTADGVPDHVESSPRAFRVYPDVLQGGLGRPGGQARHRGGRQVAPAQEVAIPGQAEDGHLGVSRLASVEVYKRGSGRRPEWVPDSDTVYNLHVADNNNYFANGILVGRHPWFGGLSDGQMVGKPLAQPSGRPPVQQ